MRSRPHVLFETMGADPDEASEILAAWRIIEGVSAHCEVTVVTPQRWSRKYSERLPSVQVLPVDYDKQKYPLNALEYTYPIFANRVAAAVRESAAQADLVHRLNPFAVRHAEPIAWSGRPFVIGPLGGSTLPPDFPRTVQDRARDLLKWTDRTRMRLGWTRLSRTYESAAAILPATGLVEHAMPNRWHSKMTRLCEGVDLAEFDGPRTDDPACPTVLYVGRLIPYKGVGEMLTALSALSDRPWQCQIAGSGPLEDEFRNQAARLGIG